MFPIEEEGMDPTAEIRRISNAYLVSLVWFAKREIPPESQAIAAAMPTEMGYERRVRTVAAADIEAVYSILEEHFEHTAGLAEVLDIGVLEGNESTPPE